MYSLCSLFFVLCSLLFALCSLLFALCSLFFALGSFNVTFFQPQGRLQYSPIVHIRTNIPKSNLTFTVDGEGEGHRQFTGFTPECIKYAINDTVRMTYVQHYLPILLMWCLVCLTLVMSLLRHPVVTVAGSAYNRFEEERQRRERERIRILDNERLDMEEARRLGRELGQQQAQEETWNAPLLPSESDQIQKMMTEKEQNNRQETKETRETTKRGDQDAYQPPLSTVNVNVNVTGDGPKNTMYQEEKSTTTTTTTTNVVESLTKQEQFVLMLNEFSMTRDPQYMISVLHSLQSLFSESRDLRSETTTKMVLIQRAKSKRQEDGDVWNEEVALAFGACLRSLSLLGRLGIPTTMSGGGGSGSGGGSGDNDRQGLLIN